MSFEIVHRGVALHRPPGRPPLVGDVAAIDGRLFARWLVFGQGGTFTACREWSEEEDPATAPLPQVQDWWRFQDERVQTWPKGHHKITAAEIWREDENSELHKFAREWPTVAGTLGIAPTPRPPGMVDVGEILYPRDLAYQRWRQYLERHVGGDLGLEGRIPESPIADQAALWTLALQPGAVQARHAIDTRSGVIRSSYPAEQGAFPVPQFNERARHTVDFVTVYGARGKRTVVFPTLHREGINET